MRVVADADQGRVAGGPVGEPAGTTTGNERTGDGGRADRRLMVLEGVMALVRSGPLLMLLVLVVGLSILEPVFLTPRNLGNVLAQSAVICVLAMGQLLVIVTRGIDLSVGATVALASVVGALAAGTLSSGLAIVAVMLATGLAVGVVNGVVYVWGRMPHPFIVTLATMSVARGLALWLADGRSTIPGGVPDLIRTLGSASVGPVPVSAIIVAALAVVIGVFSKRQVWGRWIFAVGGNQEAARRSAIPVSWVLASVYMLSGLLAGVGAVLASGRSNGGSPNFGQLAELDSIAAVVIGGASFLGGRGNVGNAIVGALMIGVIRNGMNLLNLDAFVQLIVIGVVIAAAVEMDVVRGALEGRLRVLRAARMSADPTVSTPSISGGVAAVATAAPVAAGTSSSSSATSSAAAGGPATLAVRGAVKRFGAVLALDHVDLQVRAGEVLALLGDNGAGKSTLIKSLSGVHRLDEGVIEVDGRPVVMHAPADARAHGIETVYQDLALFDNLDASANFYAGREIAGPGWLPRGLRFLRTGEMDAATREVLDRFQVHLPSGASSVGLMSGGQRQAVAVARAAAFSSRVVILDEPTAALGVRESRRVLDLVIRLRDAGHAVIVISHAMDHVAEIADRALVMRRGRVVGEIASVREDQARILALIMGGDA
ncbi:MAG: ATP-binding cassette domain-containing protein [Chloroflexota bacterium]